MNSRICGFTLIELVIAIVIIGVAVTGILAVMNETTAHSADPMIEHQEIAIAEAYMEEILTKSYTDNGVVEGSRANYDGVDDYNNLSDTGAHDEFGNSVNGLGSYDVAVTVSLSTLGAGAAAITAKYINVKVTGPNGTSVNLSGYRTDY